MMLYIPVQVFTINTSIFLFNGDGNMEQIDSVPLNSLVPSIIKYCDLYKISKVVLNGGLDSNYFDPLIEEVNKINNKIEFEVIKNYGIFSQYD